MAENLFDLADAQEKQDAGAGAGEVQPTGAPNLFEQADALEAGDAERLDAIFKAGQIDSPDERASKLALIRQTGMAPEYVEAAYPRLKAAASAAQFDPRAFLASEPDFAREVLAAPQIGRVALVDQKLHPLIRAWRSITGYYPAQAVQELTSGHPENVAWGQRDAIQARAGELKADAEAPRQVAKVVDPAKDLSWWEKLVGKGHTERIQSGGAGGLYGDVQVWKTSGPGDVPGVLEGSLRQGALVIDRADVWNEWAETKRAGKDTWEIEKRAAALESRMMPHDYGSGLWPQTLAATGETLPAQGQVWLTAGVSANVARVAVTALTKKPALGAVAGEVAGHGGAFLSSFRLERGNAIGDYGDLRTDDGKPVSDDLRIGLATVYGVVAATIESANEMGPALEAFGPVGRVFKTGRLKQAMGELLQKDPRFRKIIADVAMGEAKGVISEFGEEGAQSLAESALGYLARVLQADKVQSADVSGAVAQALDEGTQAGLGRIIPAAGGSVTHLGTRLATRRQAQVRAAQLGAAIDGTLSPTAQADADFYARVVAGETAKSGEPLTSFHVDPAQLTRLFQDEETSAAGLLTAETEQAATELMGPEGPQRVRDALATGSKIEVPVAEFAAKWASRPGLAEALKPHVSSRAWAPTLYQEIQDESKREEQAKAIAEAFDSETPPPPSAEEQPLAALAEDLVKAGRMEAGDAAADVLVWRKHLHTMAVRSGVKLTDLVQRFVVKVQDAQEPRAAAAAVMQEAVAPASAALAKTLGAMTPEQRAAAMYRDASGVLNERAFRALPPDPARPMVAHLSVEGTKWVNKASHSAGNRLYATVARALAAAAPEGMPSKVGGDFALRVSSQEEADAIAAKVAAAVRDELRAANPGAAGLEGLEVTAAAVPAGEDARQALREAAAANGAAKAEREGAGARAPRGERPRGLPVARPEDLAFPEGRAEAPLPAALQQAAASATDQALFEAVYLDPGTGLLSREGFFALPAKAHVASLDLNGLRRVNEEFGEDVGDEMLRAFADAAVHNGASAFDFAHLSGDEYALQSDDQAALQTFIDRLADACDVISVGGEPSITFGYGIGATYDEADRGVEAHKRAGVAADREARAARAEGRRGGGAGEGRAADHRGAARQAFPGVRGGVPSEGVAVRPLFWQAVAEQASARLDALMAEHGERAESMPEVWAAQRAFERAQAELAAGGRVEQDLYRGVPATPGAPSKVARFGEAYYYADRETVAKKFAEFRGEGSRVETKDVDLGSLKMLDLRKVDEQAPEFNRLANDVGEALDISPEAAAARLRGGYWSSIARDLARPAEDALRRAREEVRALAMKDRREGRPGLRINEDEQDPRLPEWAREAFRNKPGFWPGQDTFAAMVRAAGYDGLVVSNPGGYDDVPGHVEYAFFRPPPEQTAAALVPTSPEAELADDDAMAAREFRDAELDPAIASEVAAMREAAAPPRETLETIRAETGAPVRDDGTLNAGEVLERLYQTRDAVGWLDRFEDHPLVRETYRDADLAQLRSGIEMARQIMQRAIDKGILPEEGEYDEDGNPLSPLRTNQDFGRSLDFTTICPRQDTFTNTVHAVERKIGKLLTPERRHLVGLMLREAGAQPACWYCYGQAGRDAYDLAISKVLLVTRRYIEAAGRGARGSELAAIFQPESGEWKWNPRGRLAEWLKGHWKKIEKEGLPDEVRLRDLARGYVAGATPLEESFGAAARAHAQGATHANDPKGWATLKQQILRARPRSIDRWNGRAGLRLNSQTDFRPWHVIEMAEAIASMKAIALKAHVYTKESDFLRVFGRTGIKFNLSAAYVIEDGKVKRDARGQPVFDGVVGMAGEDIERWVKDLPDVAGGMLVAVNDEALLAGLDDDRIHQIIPYHAGAVPAAVDAFQDARDFSSYQHEKGWETREKDGRVEVKVLGKWVRKGQSVPVKVDGRTVTVRAGFSLDASHHRNDQAFYLALTEKLGLTAKFADLTLRVEGREVRVIDHPAYMKLIRDVARAPEKQAVPDPSRIDWPAAYAIEKRWIEQGGDEVSADPALVKYVLGRIERNAWPEASRLPTEAEAKGARSKVSAAAKRRLAIVQRLEQPAYHGTPHRGIEAFSLEKIGTGEGAQAYGWGLYFAEKKGVAEDYRKKLTGLALEVDPAWFKGPESEAEAARGAVETLRERLKEEFSLARAWQAARDETVERIEDLEDRHRQHGDRGFALDGLKAELAWLEAHPASMLKATQGQTYVVEVPEAEELLDWDAPLSEQPPQVAQRLRDEGLIPEWKVVQEGKKWFYQAEVWGEKIARYQAATKKAAQESADEGNKNALDMSGEDLYHQLARASGNGGEGASGMLLKAGIPGLRYLDGTSRSKGEGTRNFVIWDESRVSIADTLYQGDRKKGGARGWLETVKEKTRTLLRVMLTQDADLSTFLHESGHAFMEILAELAQDPNATQGIKDDWAAALKFMGARDLAEMQERRRQAGEIRAQAIASGRVDPQGNALLTDAEKAQVRALVEPYEKWARGFEAYLREGKAPSLALAGAFQRFKLWLTAIYRDVSALNVDLNDEIRGVFDRILATDEEIQRSRRAMGPTEVFTSPEQAGMTPEAWKAYLARMEKAVSAARLAAESRALREKLKVTERWWKAQAEARRAEAAAEYAALPAARALAFLRDGEAGGSPALEAIVAAARTRAAKEDRKVEIPAAARARLDAIDTEIRRLEVEKRLGELTEQIAFGGVPREEARERARQHLASVAESPIRLESSTRTVLALSVMPEDGSARSSIVGPYQGEVPAGHDVRAVSLPTWLSLDDYLAEEAVWDWTWAAFKRSQTDSEMAQRLVADYVRRAFETFPGPDRSLLFRAFTLARFLAGEGNNGDFRRSITAQIEAWVQTPPDSRRFDDPISERVWEILQRGKGTPFGRWEAETRHHLVGPPAWVGRPVDPASVPVAAPAPDVAAIDAKLGELAKERAKAAEAADQARAEAIKVRPRLDYAAVLAAVGEETAKKRFRGLTTVEEGLDPDTLAELMQVEDGPSLLREIAALRPADEWARERAEELLRADYPEVADELAGLKEAVEKGLHDDVTADWLLEQFDLLRRRAFAEVSNPETGETVAVPAAGRGQRKTSSAWSKINAIASIKRAADLIAQRTVVARLDAGGALSAERSAAEKAAEAVAKGDYRQAFILWQQRLLNFYLGRALSEARDAREDLLEQGKHLKKPATRGKLGKASPALRDASDAILEAFGLMEPLPPAAAPRRSLGEAVAAIEASGVSPLIDPEVLGALMANPPKPPPGPTGKPQPAWKGLTVAQMRTVLDALKNIRAAGAAQLTVLLDGKRIAWEELKGRLLEEGERNLPDLGPVSSSVDSSGVLKALGDLAAGMQGELLRPETMIRWLGAKDLESDWFRSLVLPLQQAKHYEADLLRTVAKPLMDALEAVPPSVMKRMRDRIDGRRLFPGHTDRIEAPTRRYELLSLAMNLGNESNTQRMLEARSITWAEALASLSILTREELDYVQAVWDAAESLKPLSFALEERVSGAAPPAIEARAFTVTLQDGSTVDLRGGYFPVVYDPRVERKGMVQAAEAQNGVDFLDPSVVRPGTAHGHLKGRVEGARGVIALDPTVIQAHIYQVVHDIAFREAIISTSRILLDDQIRVMLQRRLGKRADVLVDYLKDVGRSRAAEAASQARTFTRVLRWLRSNQATGLLSYAADVVAGDLTNPIVSSISLKDPTLMAGAIADCTRAPLEMRRAALAKSGELRVRADTLVRMWKAERNALTKHRFPGREQLDFYVEHGFDLFEMTDALTATPAWWAGYREGVKLYAERSAEEMERLAVEYADALVRETFPSQSVVDMSALRRDKGFWGSAMLFFGYLNLIFDRRSDIAHEAYLAFHEDGASAGSKSLAVAKVGWKWIALVAAYQILGEWLSGRGPEKDEERWQWFLRKMLGGLTVNDVPFGSLADPFISKVVTGKSTRVSARTAPGLAVVQGAGESLMRAIEGEGEAKDYFALLRSLGIAAGVPTRPLRGVEYLTTGGAQEDVEEGRYLDVPSGVIYGERERQGSNPLTTTQDLLEGN